MTSEKIDIREVSTVEELGDCVRLQKQVFATPDLEISPVRHLIVTKSAGGWTLGAYYGERLVGFVLSVPAFRGTERYFYSHMTAVDKDFQSYGIGAKLKWAQRERALSEGVNFIKWTFQPVQARNAFFNLEKLGAVIREYKPNFYGTDYTTSAEQDQIMGLDSDRVYAEWNLGSEKVEKLAQGERFFETEKAVAAIEIPNDWNSLVLSDPQKAVDEQNRIKEEFYKAFAKGLVAKSFERSETKPRYLLFKE